MTLLLLNIVKPFYDENSFYLFLATIVIEHPTFYEIFVNGTSTVLFKKIVWD